MKVIIRTDKAPAAIGPYSQAVKVPCGTMLFCSGQIPLDPKTMEVVGTDAREHTRRVMDKLGTVLKEAGVNFSNVVKTTIFLADMSDFVTINEVYAVYFDDNPPARAAVQVARLPKDVRVQIDAIAVIW